MKRIIYTLVTLHLTLVTVLAQPVTQEWVRRYSGIYIPPNSNGGATGKSIELDSLGNIYVLVGEAIWDPAFGAKGVFGVMKYNSSGNSIWSTYYSTPGNVSDGSVAFAVSKRGDVYVTGYTGINFIYHTTTVKFDSSGVLKWTKIYSEGDNDEPTDIAVDKEGNVIVVGYASAGSNSANALTIKYNSNGDSLWVRKLNQFYYSNNYRVAIDDSNTIYTVGEMGNSSTESDYLILKYNKNGNLLWFATYNSPENYSDFGHAIAVDHNRNVYVVGTTYIIGFMLNNTLIKINPIGVIQWSRVFTGILSGNGRCQYPAGIAVAPDGNSIYYTTFCTNGTGGSGYDIVTLKYNSVGDSQWVRRYWGGVNSMPNVPSGIKLDKYGDIYVVGTANYQTSGDDYVLIKYLSTGVQKWVATYNGPLTNSDDLANDLFIDTNLIYVTGISSRQNTPYFYWDAATIKYSQLVGLNSANSVLPAKYILHQNYPNPFNSSTTIVYELPKRTKINISIFNTLGQLTKTLADAEQDAGYYSIITNFENLSSDIYFYSLKVNGQIFDTKKLVLIK